MHLITFLILLVTVAILFLLWQLAADVRAIRHELPRELGGKLAGIEAAVRHQGFSEGLFRVGWGITSHHQHAPPGVGCFIIWEWRDGDWQAQGLREGVKECLPPNYPGAFPGDIARTWAILSGK